jgi:hypothetical protein
MSNNENIRNYTAADIEDYLEGKLTPLQMNAIEKAALNDPFLAEALEGYETIPLPEWKGELAALKEQFLQQKATAKIIDLPKRTNLSWLKVAAAVLIIGGVGTFSYLLINKQQEPVAIAKNTNAADLAFNDTTKRTTASESDSIKGDLAKQEITDKAAKDGNNVGAITDNSGIGTNNTIIKSDSKLDTSFVYTPTPAPGETASTKPTGSEPSVAAEKIVTNNSNTNNMANAVPQQNARFENETEGYATQKDRVRQDKDEDNKRRQFKEQALNNNFIAQVVTPDNTPLPFANISIKSESFGTYADARGNFRLIGADSVLTVEVKSVGYQTRSYNLNSNSKQNKIILQEDLTTYKNRTVVSGATTDMAKNKTSRRVTLTKDSLTNVEPADGWDNYSMYADNNIEIPDDITKKNIHGTVELSFDVKRNGAITNIKVDKSLCDNCDEAAKKLLQQGPQWRVKKGRAGKGKIVVEF